MQRAPPTTPGSDPTERALARTLGLPDLVARVLIARGLGEPDNARAWMAPDLRHLADPFRFTHMERAVARIRDALTRREPILIHGDYDVDGVSGTVLLTKFLAAMHADVKAFVPARKDGYSFSDASFDAIEAGGIKLCISVDNGTNAVRVIERIQQSGCDVIVTDHHGTSEDVAPAHTILNPRLPDAGYPDRDLAGVGVAFRLCCAVAESFTRGRKQSDEFADLLLDALGYVALGTIADVAPLRGENRILVYHGLRALAASRSPGIRALLDSAGLSHRSPDTDDVAFRIAPLINAAGRVGHAGEAVRLLMAEDSMVAQAAAKVLETHNVARRKIERQLYDELVPRARACNDPVVVLGGDDWHPGVLGIVAARLVDACGRPAVLVGFDGPRGRGSGRSCRGIDLRAILSSCSPLMNAYGGHAAAVGMEVERSRFDEFRRELVAAATRATPPAPTIAGADGVVHFSELDPRDVRKLDLLGPFGAGNRRPTFRSEGVRIVGHPIVDGRGSDLRFRLAQDGTMLPARIRGGATRHEAVRALSGPLHVVHAPRVASASEEGPVELLVVDLSENAPSPSAP